MGFNNLSDLDAIQLDALREVGNIGSGHAATSLASLLHTNIQIEIPSISLINYDHVSQYLGGKDRRVIGLALGLGEELHGVMLHVVQLQFASHIINAFYPRELHTLNDINDMDLSAIKETSNITTASYVNAMAQLTNLFINITPPVDYIDTVDQVLKHVSAPFDAIGNQVLYIDENLHIGNTKVQIGMILILQFDSLKKLFERLKVPC